AGAAVEVTMLHRPLIPALAIPMAVLFVLANMLRWWVIGILAEHWNVEVMASSRVGVVASGPYRWARHPNYVAVAIEVFFLPMMHTAWITALAGAPAAGKARFDLDGRAPVGMGFNPRDLRVFRIFPGVEFREPQPDCRA